jgi:hypothetical protein
MTSFFLSNSCFFLCVLVLGRKIIPYSLLFGLNQKVNKIISFSNVKKQLLERKIWSKPAPKLKNRAGLTIGQKGQVPGAPDSRGPPNKQKIQI